MKILRIVAMTFLIPLSMTDSTRGGEILYNGIELPDQWPPKKEMLTYEPMTVPYLENIPEVIPIDVGRQLFVDDFLIEKTTLKRTFHTPEYHPANPVLKPDKPWENKSRGWYAAPFSGGTWYDPADKLFKMWYTGGYLSSICYATSRDGIRWEKPELNVEKGTNIVLEPVKKGDRRVDTSTIWLDHDAKNPNERFKYFATEAGETTEFEGDWGLAYRRSPDGIHWSEPLAKRTIFGDRTTAFYNPFREVWVLSERVHAHPPEGRCVGRARAYLEAKTAWELAERMTDNGETNTEDRSVLWTNADDRDPRHTVDAMASEPQLYNLDATPYESLMIGLFSIWQGPPNNQCDSLKLQKRNDILLGFSRDGFHWDRPDRSRFISCSWEENDWRFGNVQSAGGGFLVVGDRLYFYFSGRAKPGFHMYDTDTIKGTGDWDADAATGLAILRRDGFASMDADSGGSGQAGERGGTLTTRPLSFKGRYLFANVDCPEGELKAEVLDKDGKVIEPFTLENCKPVSCDKALAAVIWKTSDLSAVSGKPVRFRFHLENGSLYSFWVSSDMSGASNGYVAAGGPGFTGPTDTVGNLTAK